MHRGLTNKISGRTAITLIAGCLSAAFASTSAFSADAPVTPPDRLAAIRTPAEAPTPRITGARVYGARPGRPFFFHVPITGSRPIQLTASDLPAGLTLDPATGIITGVVTDKGSYSVKLTAANSAGQDTNTLTLTIGDTICLTPPLGWNSWNFFAGNIDESKIRGAADAMVATGLINHGWTYINMDDRWEGQRDPDGKIEADAVKFPDVKKLSDYIHGLGLKFGIYSSPGPTTCARAVATYQHEDQDAQSYADWGVDYVKYDWCSYGTIAAKRTLDEYSKLLSSDEASQYAQMTADLAKIPRRNRTPEQTTQFNDLTAKLKAITDKIDPDKRKVIDLLILQEPYAKFRASLDKVNRDIVFSFCQYGMGNVSAWGAATGGNLWRTTGDITATWRRIAEIGFAQDPLAQYASPGHWNDPDMLEVGNGKLTTDENFTHMTLWCVLAAPLLIGCEMPKMDAFTVSLFSNDEVLAVDQDPLGKQGYRIKTDGQTEVWVKPLTGGAWAVALFNRGDQPAAISATWAELKLSAYPSIRDLWRQKNIDASPDGISAQVNAHGAELYRVEAAGAAK